MKKLLYLFTAATVGLLVTGCDPVEDINEELEANEAGVVDVFNYTLTEGDYLDVLELSFPNFNSVDDAKTLIPQVLDENFPVLGANSLAAVTFDIYNRKSTEDSLLVYSVKDAEYAEYNPGRTNFDKLDQIQSFLNDKYPNATNRLLVSLTYKFYSGKVNEVNNGFLYVNNNWEFIQGLSDDDYYDAGQNFNNFDSETQALEKLPYILKEKYKYGVTEENTVLQVMYKLYTADVSDLDGDGNKGEKLTYSYVVNYIYQNSQWIPYTNTIPQTLQFGNDGSTWIPDNTIAYSFTSADVTLIVNALGSKYPGPTSNVGQYGSFDRRSGSSNYWDDDMMIEAVGVVLNNLDPNAEEGQKYAVTAVIYNGSTTNELFLVIKKDGNWVAQ